MKSFNIGDTVKFRGFITKIRRVIFINGDMQYYIDTNGRRSYAVVEFHQLEKI